MVTHSYTLGYEAGVAIEKNSTASDQLLHVPYDDLSPLQSKATRLCQ